MHFKRTETSEMLKREFKARGIRFEIEKTPGGHLRWRFNHQGADRWIITASTPSDRRGAVSAKAELKRMLRID
jgi:ribosomal protein L34E